MVSPTIRDTSPVAVLMDPKNDVPASERDMRLEDYLNDRIQTTVDLGGLASLIETVDIQKKQLDQQVNFSLLLNDLRLDAKYGGYQGWVYDLLDREAARRTKNSTSLTSLDNWET